MNKPSVKMLLSVILLTAQTLTFAQTEIKLITLDDIYKNRRFSAKGVYGLQSMNDGEHYCQLKKDSLNLYDYATGNYTGTIVTAKKLIPAGDTVPIAMSSFEFSDDETRILFATDEEPIYRRSSKAAYYIYDIRTEKLVPLSKKGKQRLATFSPDGSKVAFVRDNNLFIQELGFSDKDIQKGELNATEYQVTFDGKMNEIINGATDWVYEEEFEFSKAFEWSPDGKSLAYYRFDEKNVREYQLTYYGDLYPEQYKYKYPKAGEDNSLISIHIYNLEKGKTLKADVGKETDIYIPRILWTQDPGILSLYRMNRHQNHLDLMLIDASTGKARTVYTEDNRYYIEINDNLSFLKGNMGFVISSEKDGYRHLYHYDMQGKLVNQLTKGQWEVTDLYGIDEEKGKVYYASAEVSPVDRDIFVISLDGTGKQKLSTEKGSNGATFNKTFTMFIHRWSDINTPPVFSLCNADGKVIRNLQDNAKLRETKATYQFANAEFVKIKTRDGVELNAAVLKPHDFDPSNKYPVLFTIYGGPGSQTVLNSWGTFSSWNQLWSQHGIIVVSVDNRGTGGRGEEFKKCTYLQLGKYETIDQVEAARYFSSLGYVDSTRIGMWGWSFGGYLTLSCLTKGADYFNFGIAVAPVTNWKYYDNIYTERFMRTPRENNEGYEDNSPVNHAAKMKGKLLMIHGMADDNVHPQNAYDMFTAMVAADKTFDSEFYPNSNHGIYTGKNTTIHLYKRMTDFILKNL
jgi:dipeptidyl-peptidase-4